ncbi:LytTR family DNA-binding domain-containing protein [Sulfitobacter aestuariivivens]|uniref:LytTR family DNA-binding domain-containing protein n=1 Tax=Sulfitobacter aestuariivivens TaxID=2766981 RepID=UPI001FEA87AE|nr:LytTR family DNA-binding domain-containing protein [Sulfitobacter aestuariivivens]
MAILTILGPFGTYDNQTLFARLVFWTATLIGVGFMVHFSVQMILNLSFLDHVTRATRIALGACIGAIPGLGMMAFVERIMNPPGMVLDNLKFIELWLQVAFISVLMALVEYWRPRDDPEADQTTDPATPVETPFHKRLPRSEDGPEDIVSLSMQDHYVEVVTTQGEHLILIRMRDAIQELADLEGLQIHRSHWVARAHLQELRSKGHRTWVRLSDGRELSVSKTYLPDVEKALGGAPVAVSAP